MSLTISDVRAAVRLRPASRIADSRYYVRSAENGDLLGLISWKADRQAWSAAVVQQSDSGPGTFKTLPGAYVDRWNAAGAVLAGRGEGVV